MTNRENDSLAWFRDHLSWELRVAIVLLFFLLPFVTLAPLSAFQPPVLKIQGFPPGYPAGGGQWTIQVWGSQENLLSWVPVPNATVIMRTSMVGDYTFETDSAGRVTVDYSPAFGSVVFEAYDSKFSFGAEWVPQETFVTSDVALFVIGFYGLGGPTVLWSLLEKYRGLKPKGVVAAIAYRTSLLSTIAGGFLSFCWFDGWKFGSEWGFGNEILNVGFPVTYYPDLVGITAVLIVSSTVLWLRLNSPHRRQKGFRRKSPKHTRAPILVRPRLRIGRVSH